MKDTRGKKSLVEKVNNSSTRNIDFVADKKQDESFSDRVGKIFAKGSNYIVNNGKNILKNKMKQGFKKVFIKSSIRYLIIFAGIFLVIFEPFKFLMSNMIASILFLGVFVWTIVSFVKVVRIYYKLPYFIIKDKSIHNGAWDFINFKWPNVARGIRGYNLVRNIGCIFSKKFEEMPEVESTVKDFLKYIMKDLIIFLSFFGLYFITVNFVAKPLLVINFSEFSLLEIYFLPFVQIKNFIIYLFLEIF